MLDNRTKALLLAVLYPVQFEQRPELGVDRVVRQVIARQALQATPAEYMNAIKLALESRDHKLSRIIPHTHSEETIRSFLRELSAKLVATTAAASATLYLNR